MINVLVFPCGSEIGLEINDALKRDKHIKLYGLSSVPCHGSFVFENYLEGISFITEETFLSELNRVIDDNNIDVLIPAYDDVVLYLSEHRKDIHCKLVTSGARTCNIVRSKINTYKELKDCSFIPRTYEFNDVTASDLPLFAKPDIGQGSQGVFPVNTLEDLEIVKNADIEYVICEMLPGREYTVDCFTNSEGELICMSMRGRNRIRNGISVNTASVQLSNEIRDIGRQINERIKFDGVWFFQVKEDKAGKYKLLEIAPRVAGSMSLSRIRGFNFILNSIYQTMGYSVRSIPHMIERIEEDRALSNEYKIDIRYDTVYLDLDDTLICGNKVNPEAMALVYQCVNKGIKIRILSRHAGKEEEALSRYHIDKNLFDMIIHVEEHQLKSSFIKDENAILIDDSFRERADVSLHNNIPVFDIDCIPALISR